MGIEIELKVAIEDASQFERVVSCLGRCLDRFEQRNVYFDTEDGALRAQKWSLRVRYQSDTAIITLKGQDKGNLDFAIRTELERSVALGKTRELRPSTVASEAKYLVAESGMKVPLNFDGMTPIGAIDNIRHVYRLPGAGEPLLVELDVTTYPDGSVGYEAELEVPETADRERAAERLRKVFERTKVPWTPSRTTKYARFLRSVQSLRD